MNIIPRDEFDLLIQGARLLEGSIHLPKVYETRDGRIVKLFRLKRWFSSRLIFPPARRFARNAARLAAAGVPSVHVERVAKVPHLRCQVVVYACLPGLSLRHALRNATCEEAEELMRAAGEFVADIHNRGVYFRSMHFGNVLFDAQTRMFSLIDILDLNVRSGPLDLTMRRRNFKHLIRYEEDRRQLHGHWTAFRDGYRAGATENAGETDTLLGEWERALG
jgi:tRNA A-37 threonylcarbamoyl transferase component Bud32